MDFAVPADYWVKTKKKKEYFDTKPEERGTQWEWNSLKVVC